MSLLKAYEEFDRIATALTAWLADTETRLEQLNKIDFWASENLEADYKVSLISYVNYYLRRRLASGEGIVLLGVRLSRCVCPPH